MSEVDSQESSSSHWSTVDIRAIEGIAKAYIVANKIGDHGMLKALCIPSAKFIELENELVTLDFKQRFEHAAPKTDSGYNPTFKILAIIGRQALVQVDEVVNDWLHAC